MEIPDHEPDTSGISTTILDAFENREERHLTHDEQQLLRAALRSQEFAPQTIDRILMLLNPDNAPIVSLTAEARNNDYVCLSHLGIDNYRIHIPIRSGLGNAPRVFDRVTCLYYTKKPRGVEPLW